MSAWFAVVLLASLSMPVLAFAGVLDWQTAIAGFTAIACLGSLIEEIVTRARNGAVGEGPRLDTRFVALVVLGALTGVALALWAG